MRAVVQKVTSANVKVDNKEISRIDNGLMVLVAIKESDEKSDIEYIKKKISALRIFEDENSKMNLSLKDVGGKILLVSQFTLYGDVRKGNRPSFTDSAKPDKANEFYEILKDELIEDGFIVESGKFRAHMEVSLINDGPVTILLDSERLF